MRSVPDSATRGQTSHAQSGLGLLDHAVLGLTASRACRVSQASSATWTVGTRVRLQGKSSSSTRESTHPLQAAGFHEQRSPSLLPPKHQATITVVVASSGKALVTSTLAARSVRVVQRHAMGVTRRAATLCTTTHCARAPLRIKEER
ncbi:unnamed protein product [Lampetra fluviatilis]